jgi:hypothetical protein
MALMQLVDTSNDLGVFHFMRFEALPNSFQQRDGKFAAEVLLEIAQAAEEVDRFAERVEHDGDFILAVEHQHFWGGPAETYIALLVRTKRVQPINQNRSTYRL